MLGGTTFQKFGLLGDYWVETKSIKPDQGRFASTKKAEARFVFRVPTLRNVAKTGPYFHDGAVDGLDNAVQAMARLQLGRTLDATTFDAIVAFSESRTGEVPPNYARPNERPDVTR